MQGEIEKRDVAGTVVLYNSSIETLNNIETYITQIEKLYVVDNSTHPNYELIATLKLFNNVQYHSLDGNKGIATALNWAATQAINDNYKILLTMDDDTRTPSSMVEQMIGFWNLCREPIGILSGVHHTKSDKVTCRKLLYTLTSGNLLNLQAYQQVGPFRDDFFIDHVDHEYGLRLNQSGYAVIELPNIRLEHQLGYTQQLKVGTIVVGTFGSHSPIRLYYFARNGVYVARQHFKEQPLFAWTVLEELGKRLIKAMFLQSNRKQRITMLITGIKHGWTDRLGKYEQLPK